MRTLSFIGLPRIDDDDDSAAISFSYLRAIHVYVPSRVSRNSFFPPLERFYVCGTCISVPTLYHRNAEIDARGGRLLSYSWPDEYLYENESVRGTINVVIVSRTNSREGISILNNFVRDTR